MIRLPIFLSLAVIALPVPALATESSATTQTASKPEKPKKICRKTEDSSYSRIGKGRVCKTAEEWAADDAKSGQANRAVRSVTAD